MERSGESSRQRAAETNALFSWTGATPAASTISLALQHLVAMIVGCVTPAIIIANMLGLPQGDRLVLIQSCLVMSAVSTLIQLFPIGGRLGSALPVLMGTSFAYLPTMQAIAESTGGVAAIFGAMIVGGVIATAIGLNVSRIRKLFPATITGTVVFTIGLSLYPTAINYMAGGAANTYESVVATRHLSEALVYGSWQNWLVAAITLAAVMFLSQYFKGIVKLAAILFGMVIGYIVAIPFHMVDISGIAAAAWFELPQPMHFGIEFEPSSCIALGILFAVNAIQAMGDFTSTTVGGFDREPTTKELKGGLVGSGLSNMLAAVFGGLPTATYSQNVGIVISTKVVNRRVFALAAVFLLAAGICPKFSAVLTTIPQCVLGGATVTVFSTIAMTGIKLITSENFDARNTTIVGLSAALGVGISQASASLAQMPESVTLVFGKSPVVVAIIIAVLLNLVLPKEGDL